MIIAASQHHDIPPPPKRFELYNGFHNWVKDKKKPRINCYECGTHAASLATLSSKETIFIPPSWKEGTLKLSVTLSAYLYLSSMNVEQKQKHEALVPISKLAEHISWQTFLPVEKSKVEQPLRKLSSILKSKKNILNIC